MNMKRFLTAVTALVLLFINLSGTAYADDDKIKNEIQAVESKITDAKKTVQELEAQKKVLSKDLVEMNSELKKLQGSISELELQINENTSLLEAAEIIEQESFDNFSNRFRIMYEQGSNAYIELILGAENLSDLINRMELMREISAHDRELYQNYKDARITIEEKQTELTTSKNELDAKNTELDIKLSDKNNEINTIVNQITEKKAEISKLEAQRVSLNTSLSSMDYADQLFAEAEKYLGMPYVFGGSTPSTSFDCSGFVCYATTHSGVYNLPRTTAQGIYNQCIKIQPSEAKRGDIIFFQGTYNAGETVTHVGFYAGNGKMLHCGNPIQYTSTNTSYWQTHFYAFGRLNRR